MWEAERNTLWALLGSGEISNKKHILQAARELFLPYTFTSPQAVNFVVRIFLRLIIYSMQGLNLQLLIWHNSCSLPGVLCRVYAVEGREERDGYILVTRGCRHPWYLQWEQSFCLQWQILHGFGMGWLGRKEWLRGGFYCHHYHTTCLIFNWAFGMAL